MSHFVHVLTAVHNAVQANTHLVPHKPIVKEPDNTSVLPTQSFWSKVKANISSNSGGIVGSVVGGGLGGLMTLAGVRLTLRRDEVTTYGNKARICVKVRGLLQQLSILLSVFSTQGNSPHYNQNLLDLRTNLENFLDDSPFEVKQVTVVASETVERLTVLLTATQLTQQRVQTLSDWVKRACNYLGQLHPELMAIAYTEPGYKCLLRKHRKTSTQQVANMCKTWK